jgi:hypothetical protein
MGSALLWLGSRLERTDVWQYAHLGRAVSQARSWDGTSAPAGWLLHRARWPRPPEAGTPGAPAADTTPS